MPCEISFPQEMDKIRCKQHCERINIAAIALGTRLTRMCYSLLQSPIKNAQYLLNTFRVNRLLSLDIK